MDAATLTGDCPRSPRDRSPGADLLQIPSTVDVDQLRGRAADFANCQVKLQWEGGTGR